VCLHQYRYESFAWMNSFLFSLQLGSVSQQAFVKAQNERLLRSIQAAPDVTFALKSAAKEGTTTDSTARARLEQLSGVAHGAGVSSIAIDRFEGRYLLSGGADSSVAIWDLEATGTAPGEHIAHLPLGHTARTSTNASLGINHVSYFPFDSLAFLTSGYDHHLKIFSSETLQASGKFDLGSTIYKHATSNVASHLLVACGSQHPAVRLVDLQSGASAHSLAGHAGSVLTVEWHPKNENILASGATDGSVRLWDIRRSASSLGVLDMDDSIGIADYDGKGTGARRRERGRAHVGAVNGITWTEDGKYLVSSGTDERMRVWDMSTGANTLANFGPTIRNAQNTALQPLLAPSTLTPVGSETIYFPNPQEILSFDLHAGTLQRRLRVVGRAAPTGPAPSMRNLKNHTTSLAWRAHNVEFYSAHSDGSIRCWRPRTWEDDLAEQEETEAAQGTGNEAVEKKRKRDELDQIVRDLTKKPVTFN
jgi:DNA excision repair protein ERCC-8